jgi:hypothetical protein
MIQIAQGPTIPISLRKRPTAQVAVGARPGLGKLGAEGGQRVMK